MQKITADKLLRFYCYLFDFVFITAVPVVEGDLAALN